MAKLSQQHMIPKNVLSYHEKDTYRIFVGSWNVGGVSPPDNLDIQDWLISSQSNNNPASDIFVFGLQEIVPLNAGNVLGYENGKISQKWNSLFRAALNKKLAEDKVVGVGDLKKVYPLKDIDHNQVEEFQCIIHKQMVGVYISVWVRSHLLPYINHPSVSCVACGLLGCLGNKGSVSVRFMLHETSFCFVCSHLASGGKEGDAKQRNANAAEILSRSSFPRGPLHNLPRQILDHNNVIWLGDLNYRIHLPDYITWSLVEKKEWSVLLENDELKMELMKGHVFQGWNEEEINFPPTYKYNPNSEVYFGCDHKRKPQKIRAPAWCDRIIWCGKGLKQDQYNRGESRLSDHRPVRAIFAAEVDVCKGFESFQSF
ncbi:type IV inositol polyphosphate 5-phosphatase 9 isoform X2 [Ziziphus jujuba]|uniref:Type IV inositol polyphosphate 5-phosphatase 9 isoform X2 n=1 Tax=Ziziphus jujuba TaxID=326968 RepID=A0ABM3IKD7_ZIZJJ|nr:type IV inositol polyphosphate 5-phosphatase 9 isoform X2 [Ziziphus jujuba]